jgi:hypothetical protein
MTWLLFVSETIPAVAFVYVVALPPSPSVRAWRFGVPFA